MYFVYILLIFVLSLIPLGDISVNQHDKVNHLIAFFVFTVLGFLAYRFGYFMLFFVGILAGGLIEIFQGFTKYRSSEVADLVADGIGIFLGIFVAFLLNKTLFRDKESIPVYNINLNNRLKEE